MHCYYNSHTIRKTKQGYEVLGMVFQTLEEATDRVDGL